MELPNFERLKYLAEEHPEKLEEIRNAYCQRLIDNAPEQFRRKLSGLLFKINMETRRSKNSIQSCIRISEMMMDSFNELREVLNDVQGKGRTQTKPPCSNNVIPFRRPDSIQ